MPYDREPYARFPLAPGLENDRGADPPGRPPPLKLGWLPPPPWKPPPPPPPWKPPPPPPWKPPPPPPPCPPPPPPPPCPPPPPPPWPPPCWARAAGATRRLKAAARLAAMRIGGLRV